MSKVHICKEILCYWSKEKGSSPSCTVIELSPREIGQGGKQVSEHYMLSRLSQKWRGGKSTEALKPERGPGPGARQTNSGPPRLCHEEQNAQPLCASASSTIKLGPHRWACWKA